MIRRLLLVTAALALTTIATAPQPGTPISRTDCDACAASCNQIPMDPTECLQLYCPECASSTISTVGSGVG